MSSAETYLQELSAELTRRGLDPERAADAVAEIRAHLRDSGGSAEEEFGSADAYAEALVTAGVGDAETTETRVTKPAFETYTFRATALDEMAILAELGRAGWELTGVREFGLIARRPTDPVALKTWEYERRNAVRHQPITREMSTAGWQPCGRWVTFHYFKRTMVTGATRT